MTKTVTVEKKIFDTLQKNNLDLMAKLEKAQYYLKKVDCYIIPIADEADYFAKVRIDEILKGGQE